MMGKVKYVPFLVSLCVVHVLVSFLGYPKMGRFCSWQNSDVHFQNNGVWKNPNFQASFGHFDRCFFPTQQGDGLQLWFFWKSIRHFSTGANPYILLCLGLWGKKIPAAHCVPERGNCLYIYLHFWYLTMTLTLTQTLTLTLTSPNPNHRSHRLGVVSCSYSWF